MKTYTITTTVTEEQVKRAEQWKALADEYNLTFEEFEELVYHIDKIKKLISKK